MSIASVRAERNTIGTCESRRISRHSSTPPKPGQHHVEDRQRRLALAEGRQAVGAGAGHAHLEPVAAQALGRRLADHLVILDEQDLVRPELAHADSLEGCRGSHVGHVRFRRCCRRSSSSISTTRSSTTRAAPRPPGSRRASTAARRTGSTTPSARAGAWFWSRPRPAPHRPRRPAGGAAHHRRHRARATSGCRTTGCRARISTRLNELRDEAIAPLPGAIETLDALRGTRRARSGC